MLGELGHDEAPSARRRRVLPLPARARGLTARLASMPSVQLLVTIAGFACLVSAAGYALTTVLAALVWRIAGAAEKFAAAAAGDRAQAIVRRGTRLVRAPALVLPAGLSGVSDRVRRTRSGRSGVRGGGAAGGGIPRTCPSSSSSIRSHSRQQLKDQQLDQHAAVRAPRPHGHGGQRRLRRTATISPR